MQPTPYPVNLRANAPERLSHWLWLVKWLLLIPHFIILVFLWIAFILLTIFAFFAILFTGKYPQGMFAFNVGVFRWTWRVFFYSYSALGTDRYPPFSLEKREDYPADLDVPYPERLSRRLVLVKWWLLAIPHYLIVAVLEGGGLPPSWSAVSLLTLMVAFVAVVLLFKGRYPRDIFDLVVGVNRWVWRVTAYAALMRDEYPPFRLGE